MAKAEPLSPSLSAFLGRAPPVAYAPGQNRASDLSNSTIGLVIFLFIIASVAFLAFACYVLIHFCSNEKENRKTRQFKTAKFLGLSVCLY